MCQRYVASGKKAEAGGFWPNLGSDRLVESVTQRSEVHLGQHFKKELLAYCCMGEFWVPAWAPLIRSIIVR